jgi:hypothetical protein
MTFQAETVVATAGQRIAVRRLLDVAGLKYETNAENAVLPTLLGVLDTAAKGSGGEPPAPAAEAVPDASLLRNLAGADLLVRLAENSPTLIERFTAWRSAESRIAERLPRWRLAERLVRLGAIEQAAPLDAVKANRGLLADPDPVAPIIQAAADALRTHLNDAWAAWEAAWTAGEARLNDDGLWKRLTPEQKHDIRAKVGLRPIERPAVDTPEAIGDALDRRSLEAWQDVTKALPGRIADAVAEAAAELEPAAKSVKLPGGLIRNTAELEQWLTTVRQRLTAVLDSDNTVIPEI